MNIISNSVAIFQSTSASPAIITTSMSKNISKTEVQHAAFEALWSDICQRVTPLFNGEGVRGSIEEANDLVRQLIKGTSSVPWMMDHLVDLARAAIDQLNVKLVGVSDEKLISRLVEVWSFLVTVLPYFQGVFLPFQLELMKNASIPVTTSVRGVLLTSFRDIVIIPLIVRLRREFQKMTTQDQEDDGGNADSIPRLFQMLILMVIFEKYISLNVSRVRSEMNIMR